MQFCTDKSIYLGVWLYTDHYMSANLLVSFQGCTGIPIEDRSMPSFVDLFQSRRITNRIKFDRKGTSTVLKIDSRPIR